MKSRPITLLTAGLAVLALPSGVWASAPEGPEEPEDPELQIDLMLGLATDEESEEYYNAQNKEQQVLIQECMNEAGFEYKPDDSSGMAVSIGPGGENGVEWAQQWGFGQWTTLDPENSAYGPPQEYTDPNEFVSELPESEQNAWYEMQQTCYDQSYNASGDPYSNPMVQEALDDFYASVDNNPRLQEANEKWADCMEDAGQPFADRNAMYDELWGPSFDWDLYNELAESEAWKPESPDHAQWQSLVDAEIATAVADATCSPDLDETYKDVVRELRPQFVDAWQNVDWDLPPVTYPNDTISEELGDEPGDTSSTEPQDEAEPIDLSN